MSSAREDFVLEPIYWDAGTARLLSRLLGDRRSAFIRRQFIDQA